MSVAAALAATLLVAALGAHAEPVKGKVALVTGASSGIGLVVSKELAKAGMKVVLTARRVDKLKEAVADIEKDGGTAAYTACDVSDGDSIAAAFAFTKETYGRVDLVFANAGIEGTAFRMPHEDSSDEDIKKTMDINVAGSALITLKHAVKAFRAQGSGDIIFSSSIAALISEKTYATMQASGPEDVDTGSHLISYAASKAALDAVARGAAGAYAPYGINVWNLNIAVFKSEMTVRGSAGLGIDLATMAASFNPIQKEPGEPVEIARVILALVDRSSKWPSGSSILVDGHYTVDSHVYYSSIYRPHDEHPMGYPPVDKVKPHLCDVRGNPATLKEEL